MAKKIRRNIISVDEDLCNGCGQCVPSCHEGALAIIETDNGPKARLVKESYCDGLGACLGECPTGALKVVESVVEPFDEQEVQRKIRSKSQPPSFANAADQRQTGMDEGPLSCGCPGTMAHAWRDARESSTSDRRNDDVRVPITSELRTWPIQLALLNPAAPYLRTADLLIAADCTAFAFADFHRAFLRGKVLAILCPKLDETEGYIEKMTRIFRDAGIRSITVVHMEVRCCFGLRELVKTALRHAQKNVPYCEAVVGIDGTIKEV